MTARIIVALDGSENSLETIRWVRLLTERIPSQVVLLTVSESGQEGELEAIRASLDRVAGELREAGIHVQTEVRVGRPADQIEDVAFEYGASLVALATRGRTGLGRWVRGSVADRVMRAGSFPLLVVNPRGLETQPVAIRRIGVPLDGSELAELALEPAATLAAAFGASTELIRVATAPTLQAGYPGAQGWIAEYLQAAQAEASAYLTGVIARAIVPSATAVVLSGLGAADELVEHAKKSGIDLFVMTTQGRSGFRRLMLGSVADRVVTSGVAPVLLVRPPSFNQPRAPAPFLRTVHSDLIG